MKSYSRVANLALLVMLFALTLTLQLQSAAIKLTPGNILVSSARFPNDTTPYEGKIFLHEYTSAGDYVQEIATPFTDVDSAVGNITDSLGRVHIYYKDFFSNRDYLSTLELDTGIWQTHYVGYPTQGGFERDLAIHGKYAFQRDTRIIWKRLKLKSSILDYSWARPRPTWDSIKNSTPFAAQPHNLKSRSWIPTLCKSSVRH